LKDLLALVLEQALVTVVIALGLWRWLRWSGTLALVLVLAAEQFMV